MTPFFIYLDWFDPAGQDRMAEGDTYGGERSFMVGHHTDMSSFLKGVLSVLNSENLTLQRIHSAGPPEDYEEDTAPPFDIDLPALIKEAREHDVLVAKPSRSFRPHGTTDSGKCLAQIDIFDPTEKGEDDYAGEINKVAVVGQPAEALEALLSHLEDDALELKALMSLYDAKDADYIEEDTEFADITDKMLENVRPDEPAWGPAFIYGSEDDA